jgi:Skp family chaperone for outer membrane proteins
MAFTTPIHPDPVQLELRGRECEAQVEALHAVIAALNTHGQREFGVWKGNAADSLRSLIDRQVREIGAAQTDLHNAAQVFYREARRMRGLIAEQERQARAGQP